MWDLSFPIPDVMLHTGSQTQAVQPDVVRKVKLDECERAFPIDYQTAINTS